MAAQYIADIHNICSDPNLPDEMTPLQYQQGTTPDISAYLQFTFWEPILYLDHESIWPSSKERSGRWLGVAHSIGDALTFWILEDQSKHILAQSVIRPFNQNMRVKWDPALDDNPKFTAQHGEDIMPEGYTQENIESAQDNDPHYSPHSDDATMKPDFVNQVLDTTILGVPASGPTTRSKGKLNLANDPIPNDESIETYTRTGKVPYKDVKYKGGYTPPESTDTPEKRRSERLKG